jgi:geranylgeranyl pyrophosphate synthase|tara:strand:+ start:245 stop:1126 length:882 start_codon:yes stop_codon:yes gene_type:complete
MLKDFLQFVQTKVSLNTENLIGNSNEIEKSMAHTSLASSKMIRAALLIASGKLNANIHGSSLITLASAVEMMHSYSLIHDDLPCMDDDDFRRSKPSNHIVFGEANAVLAGDALQALAFETIVNDKLLSDEQKIQSIKILSSACGKNGMIYGQHLDIENEQNPDLDINELDYIHNLKTGRLIESSIFLGQVGSSLSEIDYKRLNEFSANIGLAFQIKDDVLDVTSSSKKLGKTALSDKKNNKSTYVNIVGVDNSIKRYNLLIEDAIIALDKISFDSESYNYLKDLAEYVIKREN